MAIKRLQSTRKIRDILLSNRGVPASLYERSINLIKLQASIRHEIGFPLSEHLHLANFSQDNIIIFTDSPAWAAKLRFKTTSILQTARTHTGLDNLKSVRIRIDPGLIPDNSSEQSVTISSATSRLLMNVADTINDTSLQHSLARLSQNK